MASLIFEKGKPSGVQMQDGTIIKAPYIIYSGTVWNLYGKLIPPDCTTSAKRNWAKHMKPTYPSVILYAVVDRNIIPEDTAAIEMLVGNPDRLDESEVTAYILSMDDRTLCAEEEHTVAAIGPTFQVWDAADRKAYEEMKNKEQSRLIAVLEKRFPGFAQAIRYAEMATPETIERYTMKNGGAVAGPKQMMGQHMFHRLHTRTEWDNLFCCGESTVMGTGTPTVTTSGLTAANVLLQKIGREPYRYHSKMTNYVKIMNKPFTKDQLYSAYSNHEKQIMQQALRCRFCEHPACTGGNGADIRGILRRVAVGNFAGARKCWEHFQVDQDTLTCYEQKCICAVVEKDVIPIREIILYLTEDSV